MSRTVVDLPDPLQAQGAGGIPQNADDLLAQLASEEVDRLLSEADEAPLGSTEFSTADAAAPDAATIAPDEGEASLNELFNALDDDQIPTLAEDVPPPPSAPQVVAAPSAAAPTHTPGLTEMRQQADAPVPDAASPVPASAADALAAEMEEDERAHAAALRRMKQGETAAPPPTPDASPAPPPASEAPAAPAPAATAPDQAASPPATTITIDPQALEDSGPAEPGVPLLVCVLEWINAPLDGLSERVRGAIGKVALVTTFNAVGVLLYVLFFRHH
jgi:hypothetical protein